MKFSILSDLHLDFYFAPAKGLPSTRGIQRVFDDYLDYQEDVEVLIVAGDITHYPFQMAILDGIATIYNYQKVYFVTGNHELYLVSNNQRYSYKHSKDKLKEYFKQTSDRIVPLDGNVETYKGITIGGAMGWYDGTYNNFGYNYKDPVRYCNEIMNDFNMIKGYKDMYELVHIERPKFDEILNSDIIVSHFNPVTKPEAFQEQYRYERSSMFYAWDGLDVIEKSQKTNTWVFGHSHGYHEFEYNSIDFVMNAFGYPKENGARKLTIEVNPYEENKLQN